MKWIKKTMYYLFYKFDHSHSILGGFTIPLHFIPFTEGTVGVGAVLGFIFYEIHQSNKKGDRGWTEIKGFLFGYYLVGILALIGWVIYGAVK